LIIDGHVHICEPPYTQDKLTVKIADGTTIGWNNLRADASAERLLHDMDESRVDRAIIMGLSGVVSNEFLSDVVKSHPGRLYGFAWVDNPRDGSGSVRQLEKAVKELGLKGLKLHPSIQAFTPSDAEILPLVRRAAELRIPVLIHSYPWPPGYFANNLPEHIDALKKRVPEATLIVGHMGMQRFMDLISIAPQPGVYVETSWGLTLAAELFGVDFATRFVRRIGIERVIFGSDWFGFNSERHNQINLIQKMDLTREEKERILGENVRNILEAR
jgi:hypothetical protein